MTTMHMAPPGQKRVLCPAIVLLLTCGCGVLATLGQDIERGNGAADSGAVEDAAVADASAADSSAVGDGGPRDGGGPPPICGKVSIYSDDFNDGVQHEQWARSFVNPGTFLYESGGTVQMVMPSNVLGYSGYMSTRAADLSGDAVEVELVQAPSSAADVQAFLAFQRNQGNKLQFLLDRGVLLAHEWIDESWGEIFSVDYVPEEHRYWRMSEQAGLVTFAVSGDRQSWTPLGSVDSPDFVRDGFLMIGAGTYWQEPEAQTVQFDNFNPDRGQIGWCPIAQLRDGFDGDELAPTWQHSAGSVACVDVLDGALSLTVMPGAGSICHVASSRAWDLEEGAVWVRIESHPAEPGILAGMLLFKGATLIASLTFAGDEVAGQWDPFGVSQSSLSIPNDQDYSWLRISETSDAIQFAASADGRAWNTFHSVNSPVALDEVALRLVLNAQQVAVSDIEVVEFDQVNQ